MATILQLRWFIATCVSLSCSVVWGQYSGLTCDFQPDTNYEDDGIFEVRTFEVEEGILLQPGKIIGHVTLLVDNFTNSYGFEEIYFKKPYNRKTKPLPPHFDVIFINVTATENATTSGPKLRRVEKTTPSPSYTNSILNSSDDSPTTNVLQVTSDMDTVTSSEYYETSSGSYDTNQPNAHTTLATVTYVDSSTSAYPGTTLASTASTSAYPGTTLASTVSASSASTNVTSPANSSTPASTPESPTDCVVAQIVQIYDLDREETDTHYLTLNDHSEGLGIPIIVMLKVTDINDNSPVFVAESLSSKITKDVQPGQIVAEIKATDADIGTNADLRYEIQDFSERRGNATESPSFPTFLIHKKLGLVALFGSLDDLEPPSQITFSVVVKDRGGEIPCNRATSTATVSIVSDSWEPPPINPSKVSGGVIAGCVLGGVLFIGLCLFIVVQCSRKKFRRSNGQLEFMLDDENLISA